MLHDFFSFSGRLNRKPYWLRTLALVVVMLIPIALAFGVGFASIEGSGPGPSGIVVGVVFFAIFIAVFISSLSIQARRLHDRDKSAWWLLFFLFVPNIVQYGFAAIGEPSLAIVGLLISLGISIWYLVELGFLRGTPGPNRFGEDPLGGGVTSPEVFA